MSAQRSLYLFVEWFGLLLMIEIKVYVLHVLFMHDARRFLHR